MNEKHFSIKEAFSYGFKATFANLPIVFLGWVAFLSIALIGFTSNYMFSEDRSLFSFLLGFLLVIVLFAKAFLFMAFKLQALRTCLLIHDKGNVLVKDVFNDFFHTLKSFSLIFYYIGASSLFFIITGFGFLFLIIPGIILAIKYSFFDLYIVDTHCGPIRALRKSGQLTYGTKWNLFLFMLASLGLLIVSMATIIGPLFVIPATYMARVYIYRRLMNREELEQLQQMKYW